MASSASRSHGLTLRRRCAALESPVGLRGAAGFFCAVSTSHAQVWRVSCIQRRTICYPGMRESLALRDLRRFGGAERTVPIETRKRFEGGENG